MLVKANSAPHGKPNELDPPTQKMRSPLGGFSAKKDWSLNVTPRVAGWVRQTGPSL